MENLKDATMIHKDKFAELLKECEPNKRAYADVPGFFIWVERDENNHGQGHIVTTSDAETVQLAHITELYSKQVHVYNRRRRR